MADPRVLYIDDAPAKSASVFRKVARNLGIIDTTDDKSRARFADEVQKADLIVSDYALEDSLASPPGAKNAFPEYPRDGQALNEIAKSLRRGDPPIVAIYSAKLDETRDGEELASAPHLQAMTLNAAFVGDKTKPGQFEERLRLAITAIRKAHIRKGKGKALSEADLHELLSLPKKAIWRDDALRDLDLSRLPLLETKKPQIGIVDIFNWLLHRVLPYPGLLIDLNHIAIALRVDPISLSRRYDREPSILKALESSRYKGILADFYGPRWWTSGVDNLIWTATGGQRGNRSVLEKTARQWLGKTVSYLAQQSPVLLADEHGIPTGQVSEASAAVRIMPGRWPSKGPWPWASIEDVKSDPVLRALAVPDDLRAAGIA